MEFTDALLEEFQRQILLSEIGIEGQMKLFEARILIIGAGSIGTNAFLHLLRSGVGCAKNGALALFGDAKLELADLSSQIFFNAKDVGKSKLELLKTYAKAYNKGVNIEIHKDEFNFLNLKKVLKNYDLILDSTDNFASKFLINAACISENKTLIRAGISGFNLQLLSIKPFESACYSCLYGVPKHFLENLKENLNTSTNLNACASLQDENNAHAPTCAKSAILGSLAGILGSMQASQAIKIIAGIKESLFDELISFDARDFEIKKQNLNRKKDCEICSKIFNEAYLKENLKANSNTKKSKNTKTQTKEKK